MSNTQYRVLLGGRNWCPQAHTHAGFSIIAFRPPQLGASEFDIIPKCGYVRGSSAISCRRCRCRRQSTAIKLVNTNTHTRSMCAVWLAHTHMDVTLCTTPNNFVFESRDCQTQCVWVCLCACTLSITRSHRANSSGTFGVICSVDRTDQQCRHPASHPHTTTSINHSAAGGDWTHTQTESSERVRCSMLLTLCQLFLLCSRSSSQPIGATL